MGRAGIGAVGDDYRAEVGAGPTPTSVGRVRGKSEPSRRFPGYAVSMPAAPPSPSSAVAISRMRNFCTFPVTVIGNESTSFQ